jgi:aryl-alcohol dehydrogenase-like predicted oxidoreductase
MVVLEDRDLIRWCGEQGIGVVTYGPLANGLLAGAITASTTFARRDHRAERDELFGPAARARHLELVDAMRPVAERLDLTLAQLALAWNVAQPGVTAAIAGSRDGAHARANAAAGEVDLDAGTLAELDAIVSSAVDAT